MWGWFNFNNRWMRSNMTKTLTIDEYRSAIDNGALMVLDFYANWCQACTEMMPIVEQVAEKLAGLVPVYKVNIDEQPELKELARIKAIPMLTIVNKGHMRNFVYGKATEETIMKKINMVKATYDQ